MLARRAGADAADVRAELDRVDAIADELPHVELTPRRGRRAPSARPASAPIAVVPLDVERRPGPDRRPRRRPARGARRRRRRRATASSPTSSASRRCGPACRTSPRRTSRRAEAHRLPDRAADPARGVRLAGRGGAAARARLRQRDRHRRGDLLPLAGDRHVGLRDQRRLDDRHRRGGRLLAVRPRPLPRGDPRRRRARRGAPDRDAHLGPRGRLLRHHGDRLAGRPVPRRLDDDPLDGDGRDHRRRGLDPRGGHAPAGADARCSGRRAYARGRLATSSRPGRSRLAAQRRRRRARRARTRRRGRLLAALDRPRHAPAGVWPRSPAPAVLLVLAIPALSLEFGDGALRQFPEGNETRVGAELAAQAAGAGAAGPDAGGRRLRRGRRPTPPTARALAATPRRCERDPEVARGRAGRSRRATAARR